MRSIIHWGSLAILLLLGFTATAAAATAVTPSDGSLLDLARPVFDAVMQKQYWPAAALALVFACAAARKYAVDRFPSLGKPLGAALLLFGMSFGGALATGLMAIGTGAMSWALVLTSAKIALAAAGGYSLIKNLGEQLTGSKWYQDKAPAWLKPIVSIALWAFTKPQAKAEAKAEAAGDKAVASTPAPGADPGKFEQF